MIRKLMITGVLLAFLGMTTSVFAADVYRTQNGKKYHKEQCRLIKNKNAVSIDKEQAVEEGLGPCKVCFKEDLVPEEQEQGEK